MGLYGILFTGAIKKLQQNGFAFIIVGTLVDG